LNTRATILALSALLCGATHAADVLEGDFATITIGTKTYTNAHLRAFSPTEGSLRHDGGLEKIKLSDLPEPARSKFYDPQKAYEDAAAKQQAADESQARAATASKQAVEQYKAAHFRLVDGKLINLTNRVWIVLEGRVERLLPNGVMLRLYKTTMRLIPGSNRAYAPEGNLMLGGGTPNYRYSRTRELTAEMSFVACDPKAEGFYDGQERQIRVIKTGLLTINGATHPGYDAGVPYRAGRLP
jgi:hypothetical protein